ncbi:hypothetical protein EYZ11_004449 [Aspergillus tanneri]|uniref:Threonine/serine exporter-like N-terminal domain-containing protein n=1 Tax=Aspergillus tanneri TaxID=1220188 RepID=A0A4S3JKK6_9EURO|nr:hypothetical protein EYZ11_004449 [Aspergillus tanneri]
MKDPPLPPSDPNQAHAEEHTHSHSIEGEGEAQEDEKRTDHGSSSAEAHRLVRVFSHDRHHQTAPWESSSFSPDGDTGTARNNNDPIRYHGGILSHLLRLNAGNRIPTDPSGTATPRREKPKWYRKPGNTSTSTLLASGTISGTVSGASTPVSSEVLTAASRRRYRHSPATGTMRLEEEIQVTLQIAQIIARQRYIMQLCKALMRFGAPTHRLEEYMYMTAKVLEVDSQYLYVPGCMIISFDDAATRTAEVKLVRVAQGIDLGRLSDTHNVYKNVVHDVYGIEEAIHELDSIMDKKPRFNKWVIVLVYGLATAMVGPFAFNARPIDLPVIYFNGCLLGIMQHVIAPRSVLYSNVFEVTATVLTSFIARALGSIVVVYDGVLCGSLELQSHQIVAGSIRMVYAIIYSLFLGFGITVGTTIYGLMDGNATSDTSCPAPGEFRSPYVQRFPFVAAFSLCLMVVNQGKWKQTPVMVVIALSGYVTNYFVTRRLGTRSLVGNTVGAFTIGVIGNLYSRLWHGHAAAAILPAIFVLVPSGLAASGSLVLGVENADETRSDVTSSHGSAKEKMDGTSHELSMPVLGYGMVQVAIGITVGLFMAALVVYPLGKRRSGLFSF